MYELDKVVNNQSKSLYFINKDVYSLLRYGIKVKADVAAHKETGNKIKEIEVKYTIKKHLPANQVDDIFKIVKNQPEY